MNWISFLSNDWATYSGYVSTGLTLLGAILLISALLPPWVDTKKSKKTWYLGMGFFKTYLPGVSLMTVNAILSIIGFWKSDFSGKGQAGWEVLALFIVFLIVNGVGLYLNAYVLKIKRQNMKEAAKNGMTEQEYYEKVLAPQFENQDTESSSTEA